MAERDTDFLTFNRARGVQESLARRVFAWAPLHIGIYICSDLFALIISHSISLHAMEHLLRAPATALNPFQYHRYYVPFFAVVLYLFEGYKSPEMRRPESELERGVKAVCISFLGLVLFNFVVFRSQAFSRYLVAMWFVLALVLILMFRFALRAIYSRLWRAGLARRRVVFLGSPSGLEKYRCLLSTQKHDAYDVVGVLWDSDFRPATSESTPECRLSEARRWEDLVMMTGAKLLVVDRTYESEGWIGRILDRCTEMGVVVELYSSAFSLSNVYYEQDEFAGCFRFFPRRRYSLAIQRVVKRAVDILFGVVGSFAAILLAPFVWLLLQIEDRGPLFYSREFVNCDGSVKHYLKFRTMIQNAEQVLVDDPTLKARYLEQHKLKDDPRMLCVGRLLRKYSIDEFPQFFSVLAGSLTLVGPRVISCEEKIRYGDLLPKLLSFTPGVTGYWQVMGRQTTTYNERIQMDMFYIDRWSVWLDLVIIAKTFWKIVRAEGAY